MLEGGGGRTALVNRRLAYLLIPLVVAALAAGCGTRPRLPATPTHHPASMAPSPSGSPRPSSSPGPSTNPRYVFPVQTANVAYHPTHSEYPATDIFAACGSPVVAVTDGTILEVSRVDRFDRKGPLGPLNGGKSVSLLGDDGVRYYGSHLTDVATGLTGGIRVRAGQNVGTVGRTGNANGICHLHFGISPPCQRTGDWWIRRGVIWPAGFLDAWHRHVSKSPVDATAAWHRSHGCPKTP